MKNLMQVIKIFILYWCFQTISLNEHTVEIKTELVI